MVFHLKWICQEIVDGGGLKFIHDILLNHRSEAELGRTLFTARVSKFYLIKIYQDKVEL